MLEDKYATDQTNGSDLNLSVLIKYQVSSLVLGVSYCAFFIYLNAYLSLLGPAAFLLGVIFSFYRSHNHDALTAAIILVIALWAVPVWCIAVSGGIESPLLIWLAPPALISSVLLGARWTLMISILSFVAVLCMVYFAPVLGLYNEFEDGTSRNLYLLLSILSAVLYLAYFGYSYSREIAATQTSFKSLHAALEDKFRERTHDLKKSEQRFMDFAETASDWFWEQDSNFKFTHISSINGNDFGSRSTKAIGHTRWGYAEVDPEKDKSWKRHVEDCLAHRDFRDFRYVAIDASGEDRILNVSGKPIFDAAGTFTGYRGTVSDVTELVTASEKTERADRQLLNAIDTIEDGFVLFDEEDRMVICNKKYRDLYREIKDVLKPGVTFSKIIHAAAESKLIYKPLEDKEAWIKERVDQHLHPTGSFDQKLSSGEWLRIIERKTAEGGIVGLRIDVTREKQEQEELRKLSHALEQSPSMVFITNVEGNIEYVNSMFTKMSGYTAEEVIGKNPRILKSNETNEDTYTDLWSSIRAGKEWRGELKDQHKDGSSFWAYATISPVKNENGIITHFVAMHEDITQRKEIENLEHQAKKRAEIANRAKSELLANMNHELRTPLNAIIGFSAMMKSELFGGLNENYAKYANDINTSGEHLLTLINDILDVSAIEESKLELHPEDLNVSDVIEAALRMIRFRTNAASITLTCDVEDSLPLFHADKRRVKQILLNLLSNAVKFTNPNGSIALSASLDDKNGHVITVTDTGIGMNEEELAKALSEFGQVDSGLDRTHDGAGLGLPLTIGLANLHDGTFEIKSEKGKGTIATVRFPPERTLVA